MGDEMTVHDVIAFNLVMLATILSPGPAQLIAIQTTLRSGTAAGRVIGFGLGTVAAAWTLCAFLGLNVVFELFPTAYLTVKIAGALYLLYLACGMWRGAGQPIQERSSGVSNLYLRGMMVNVLNPKSVLAAASVIALVFPDPVSPMAGVLMSLNHLALELLFYSLLALTIGRPSVQRLYERCKVGFDRVASIVLGALSCRLLFSLKD